MQIIIIYNIAVDRIHKLYAVDRIHKLYANIIVLRKKGIKVENCLIIFGKIGMKNILT